MNRQIQGKLSAPNVIRTLPESRPLHVGRCTPFAVIMVVSVKLCCATQGSRPIGETRLASGLLFRLGSVSTPFGHCRLHSLIHGVVVTSEQFDGRTSRGTRDPGLHLLGLHVARSSG